jgi:hypothetical protein
MIRHKSGTWWPKDREVEKHSFHGLATKPVAMVW